MLHEGLVWKISTGGASPLRGAGPWRSYSYAEVVTLQPRMKREFFLQASMETQMLEKGVMYAEVDTRKNGSTNAEVGLMRDEEDAKALV